MATSKIKFNYEARVTNTFVLISLLIYFIDNYALHFKLNQTFLFCPSKYGASTFDFKNFLNYLQLFFYSFGSMEKVVLFSNLLFVLFLGQQMEERYGSLMLGIMFFIAAIFTGVLNACFCKEIIRGADSIIFMLILLNVILLFKKKTINCTSILIIAVFIMLQVYRSNQNGMIGILTILAGGLCGSLFAFLALPKVRSTSIKAETYKKPKKSTSSSDETISTYKSRTDRIMEQNRKRNKSNDDDDATVVGTLKF